MYLCIFYLSIVTTRIDLNYFYNVYKILGSISAIVLIAQSIGLYIFNIPAAPINLFFIPQEFSLAWGDFLGARPSAFFSEPQAAASYLIPLLAISLHKNDIPIYTIITLGILCSTSSLGIGNHITNIALKNFDL